MYLERSEGGDSRSGSGGRGERQLEEDEVVKVDERGTDFCFRAGAPKLVCFPGLISVLKGLKMCFGGMTQKNGRKRETALTRSSNLQLKFRVPQASPNSN